jgi:hypothetical protein
VGHLAIATIVFACISSSMLLGAFLRSHLPPDHIDDESKDSIKLATGLVATMAALVLGLMISSAKSSFDTLNGELVRSAASAVRLDRVLNKYGPETHDIRAMLKSNFAASLDALASGDPSRLSGVDAVGRGEELQRQVEALEPHSALQRQLQIRALQILDEGLTSRWLALLQERGSLPIPLLMLLVSWLVILFGTFGLFAPPNGTTITTLVMCALSAAGAIFLIMEMKMPLGGAVRVSLEPMNAALVILGR